ncbi:MAG: SpoIIE family protein phosphatase [Verrucomicrobiota bacterium]|nr:SpoIIE family protein phosphatase [Verrucomicrobiota bacterium]
MRKPLRVIIIEDSDFDAQLLLSMLRKGDYDVHHQRIETGEHLREALAKHRWDLIIADYNLPQFSAPEALAILQETHLDLPFIIVSGGIGESTAVAAMKAGAHDYLMKGNLARLVPVVERELREAANREGKRQTREALVESELRYRLLWETATDAVLLIDDHGTIQFANPAVGLVFGYSPNELIGKHVSSLQPASDVMGARNSIMDYLRPGRRSEQGRPIESFAIRKNGAEFPVEVVYRDMTMEDKHWHVAFIRDISDRWRTEQALRETEEQFRVAHDIQQHLFPKVAPVIPGFDLGGASFPAEATGGDYFDYLQMLDDSLGIVVGDVTGHGIGPALLMAETRAYLRVLAKNRDGPGEILTRANLVLAEDVGFERFVTLFLAKLTPANKSLSFSSAGHVPCYILDQSGQIKKTMKRTGVPLGLRRHTVYETSEVIGLQSGDIVLMLTDGFEEAASPSEELFGVDKILDLVRECRELRAREIVERLHQAVLEFSGEVPQNDDLTAVVIKVS